MIVFEHMLGPGDLYVCVECGTHLTRVELLRSKHFKGKTGPAYLIDKVWNHKCGPEEDRQLLTGQHTIQEIYCGRCETNIGWTYVKAFDEDQQYKIGKFILEKAYIRKVTEPCRVKVRSRNSKRRKVETAAPQSESMHQTTLTTGPQSD